MERSRYVLLYIKEVAQFRGELRYKSGVAIADDLSRDAEPWN